MSIATARKSTYYWPYQWLPLGSPTVDSKRSKGLTRSLSIAIAYSFLSDVFYLPRIYILPGLDSVSYIRALLTLLKD
ncbi:hypothetical protein BDV27DRAFT_125039 [Aspergillus caelatus]|uniref:Uncharacterized protein n=1 Tax=Aspergillus caelatus TaxID=61420 RepID=A0A5N7AB78_9EURO|nr:uncharacterized protein BDV27DRAFT_125039 [Aspergillus caelatus]KAE8366588.1 hypothetical protein BDV27DRAFT_125039 [Aspergillus caelatus]